MHVNTLSFPLTGPSFNRSMQRIRAKTESISTVFLLASVLTFGCNGSDPSLDC